MTHGRHVTHGRRVTHGRPLTHGRPHVTHGRDARQPHEPHGTHVQPHGTHGTHDGRTGRTNGRTGRTDGRTSDGRTGRTNGRTGRTAHMSRADGRTGRANGRTGRTNGRTSRADGCTDSRTGRTYSRTSRADDGTGRGRQDEMGDKPRQRREQESGWPPCWREHQRRFGRSGRRPSSSRDQPRRTKWLIERYGTDGMSDSLLSSHEIIDETGTREATRDARDTMRSDTSYPNLSERDG